MLKKFLISFGIICAAMLTFFAVTAVAEEVSVGVVSSDGYDCSILRDDNAYTSDYYRTDTVLTLTASETMTAIYIKWDSVPGDWILTDNGQTYTYGSNGFLHEFITLPSPASEVTITIKTDRTYVNDIYGFNGDIPSWVQQWEPAYDKADILYISTHSDDDVLFFGGLIPTYTNDTNIRVQAAYFVDHSMSGESGVERYRLHEALDCIWHMGITHYPKMGEFADAYSESLEGALENQSMDSATEYVVRLIRMFKPQVLISQDFEGEYGHGQHRLVAAATANALEISNDASQYPESANAYGVWDVPKTYYHLYGENQIVIDDKLPLDRFGGKTALTVATEGYEYHLSQQWMWYYVSDDYEYACNRFGLYRTTVGYDTGNDVMENLIPYNDQPGAAETTAETTTETTGGNVETPAVAEETVVTAQTQSGENVTDAPAVDNSQIEKDKTILIVLIIVAAILAILIVVVIVNMVAASKTKKRRKTASSQNEPKITTVSRTLDTDASRDRTVAGSAVNRTQTTSRSVSTGRTQTTSRSTSTDRTQTTSRSTSTGRTQTTSRSTAQRVRTATTDRTYTSEKTRSENTANTSRVTSIDLDDLDNWRR